MQLLRCVGHHLPHVLSTVAFHHWSVSSVQIVTISSHCMSRLTVMLYFFISPATCATFPLWYMVFTFHVPMVVFLVRERVFGPVASKNSWLSPRHFIGLHKEGPSSTRTEISKLSLVDVSVAFCSFYRVGLLTLCLAPNLEDQ